MKAVAEPSQNIPKAKDKTLNIDLIEQSLWLVKVPQFVAERWATAKDDEIVGKLQVTLKASADNKPPTKQLNVFLGASDGYNGPDKFTLEETNPSKDSGDSFVAFSSEKDSSEGFCIDGKVTKNLLLKPHSNLQYHQLIRDRGLNKIANRKETFAADMTDVERNAKQSHTVEFITSDRMELKRKAAADKSTSGSKSIRSGESNGGPDSSLLRSRVFEAFEKNERLLFKDLLTFCATVPGFSKDKDLRDILEQYCTYNHRGTYKQFWELKPEYRDSSLPSNTK